ncbi:hypothetical protein [Candidatus Borrarchaeum sp.]|uniref:hypothetical protein n=1 Tax=Candidatus Borrarchaeum sp. TaxID=2846742 RepID=UPI00257F225D|nr:hypothetical protein [Candidatus Borrarchaeum sp.]
MSLDEFLTKKKKGSKEPPLKDEPLEPLPDPITESEPFNTSTSEDLWSILVEAVKGDVVLFPNLKAYVQGQILPREPDISPKELASRLNISIGTAMVLLSEIKSNSISNDQR